APATPPSGETFRAPARRSLPRVSPLDSPLQFVTPGRGWPAIGKPRHSDVVFVFAVQTVHAVSEACLLGETQAAIKILRAQVARAHVQFDLADARVLLRPVQQVAQQRAADAAFQVSGM